MKTILIDYENINDIKILMNIFNIKNIFKVCIIYSNYCNDHFSLDFIYKINKKNIILDLKKIIIPENKNGKNISNFLDFYLINYIHSEINTTNIEDFIIISNDKDYIFLTNILKESNDLKNKKFNFYFLNKESLKNENIKNFPNNNTNQLSNTSTKNEQFLKNKKFFIEYLNFLNKKNFLSSKNNENYENELLIFLDSNYQNKNDLTKFYTELYNITYKNLSIFNNKKIFDTINSKNFSKDNINENYCKQNISKTNYKKIYNILELFFII